MWWSEFNPRTHTKPDVVAHACFSSAGEVKQEDLWGSLANQPNLICEPQVPYDAPRVDGS